MYSTLLWNSITDIFSEIQAHPFIRSLITGTLPERKFKFYVIQDYLYLKEYKKVLLKAGIASNDDKIIALFIDHVNTATTAELKLYNYFIHYWQINSAEFQIAPITLAYSTFLHYIVDNKSFPEILGAILPCDWIYLKLGKMLVKVGSKNEKYAVWIQNYGMNETYEKSVQEVIALLDKLSISPEELNRVKHNFRLAAIYEYMFWDSAYKEETYPFKL